MQVKEGVDAVKIAMDAFIVAKCELVAAFTWMRQAMVEKSVGSGRSPCACRARGTLYAAKTGVDYLPRI